MTALGEFQPLLYTGALSAMEKDAVLSGFRTNSDRTVLVLSLRAGGQGLNLQEASYVFHFDRWWNPAVERQAEDRSHRLGQTLSVNVYQYVCEGTIEERIEEILRKKQLLFDQLVDEVSIDVQTALNAEELFGLFGLRPPKSASEREHRAPATPNFTSMTGQQFEQYVRDLLQRHGWRVELTPVTRDGGIDLVARKPAALGVESVLFIQCKNHATAVGVDYVRELNGALPEHAPGASGVLICQSGFTSDAAAFAKERGVLLWDRRYLDDLARGSG